MNFKDILNIYSKKAKVQPCIEKETELPGSTTLEKLNYLFKSRQSSTIPPKFPKSLGKENKVVICLVIVDTLHHESIWKRWIEQGREQGCSIKLLVHAKYPEKIISPWVKEQALSITYTPEWNSPEVVRGMMALLEEGLEDPDSACFVFGTETCIPIYPPEYVCKVLLQEEVSWLKARHRPEGKWEAAACFQSVDPNIIPKEAVWKSLPGWIMLTRRHAYEAWGSGGTWSEDSGNVFAPEEVYFPTMLALLGYLRDETPSSSSRTESQKQRHDEVLRQMVTYAEWARHGDANPINFARLDIPLLRRLRSTGALFARKFGPGSIDVITWENLVVSSEASLTIGPERGLSNPSQDLIKDKISRLREENMRNLSMSNSSISQEFITPCNNAPLRLAILLIIIDSLPHEALWRIWADELSNKFIKVDDENSSEHKDNMSSERSVEVRFLVHAKRPDRVTSAWVRRHLARSFHLEPEWGSVELTEVMIRLLTEAVDWDDNTHAFCFCSESCVPACTAAEAYAAIATGRSWLNYSLVPNNGYAEQKQFVPLRQRLPADCVCKADQWLLLTRSHAVSLLGLSHQLGTPLLPLFRNVVASDEMYFPSCLRILGLLDADTRPSDATDSPVTRRRVTYCVWEKGARSPAIFRKIEAAQVSAAAKEGALFLRKLMRDRAIAQQTERAWRERVLRDWLELVLGVDPWAAHARFENCLSRGLQYIEEGIGGWDDTSGTSKRKWNDGYGVDSKRKRW